MKSMIHFAVREVGIQAGLHLGAGPASARAVPQIPSLLNVAEWLISDRWCTWGTDVTPQRLMIDSIS